MRRLMIVAGAMMAMMATPASAWVCEIVDTIGEPPFSSTDFKVDYFPETGQWSILHRSTISDEVIDLHDRVVITDQPDPQYLAQWTGVAHVNKNITMVGRVAHQNGVLTYKEWIFNNSSGTPRLYARIDTECDKPDFMVPQS